MPRNLEELAQLIARRDAISYNEAMGLIKETAAELEIAFMNGDLYEAEDIMADMLGLEPDYLDLFIF